MEDSGLNGLDETLQLLLKVREILQSIFDEGGGLRGDRLNHVDKAKFSTSLAFTIASLFYISLSLEGKDPQDHLVIEDISRIKAVVAQLLGKSDRKEAKRIRLDKDASQRMILHAL